MHNKYIGLLVVALLLLGAGVFIFQRPTPQTETAKTEEAPLNTGTQDLNQREAGSTPAPSIQAVPSPTTSVNPNSKAGSYQDYSTATIATEQKAGNKVVLFFHAPWCPYCKAADIAFKANATSIPAGVTVLKTDYDSNTELKKKYGVTYQHTFVQIDTNGNQVSKWNGGDIDNLIKYIK